MKSAPASQPKVQRLLANPLLKAFTTALLISGGSLGLVAPALAEGTTAGTDISNTAVGSFQNPNDTSADPTTVTSNEVIVTVSEVAGIELTANGTQEATAAEAGTNAGPTQEDGQINAGDVVYFTYTITNTGNDTTPFFIPGSPSNIQLNGAGNGNGGTLSSPIEIVSVSTDGTNQTPLTGVTVPAGGISTDDPNLDASVLDSIPVNGTVTIRVPVKLAPGLSDNDTVDVVLGSTTNVGDQNVAVDGNNTDDSFEVRTKDNAGTTNGDIDGAPSNGERESSITNQVIINAAPRDFGDLPDTDGVTGQGNYQTTDANGGPSHFTNGTTFLGTAPTNDDASAVTGFAGGTDASGDANDDGVTITSDTITTATGLQGQDVLQGQQITLEVTTSGDGNLQGWFDWNQDGDFDDDGEDVLASATTITGTGTVTSFNVTVPFGATAGDTFAMFRYSEEPNADVGTTGVGGYGEVETFQVTVIGSEPELSLVKRVTAIASPDGAGGFIDAPETGIVNDNVANSADDEANWPANYLKGTINSSNAAPGDQIEYSLYFLSSGNDDITNLNICDMIPANTEFVAGSIELEFNGTTTQPGGFFSSSDPNAPDPSICPADNGKGGILVNVVSDPATVPNATAPQDPINSFGTIKFRVKVD